MKPIFHICLLALFSSAALAQDTYTNSPLLKSAVILVIRHAEKPASGNDLTPAGYKRAEAYVRYFQNLTVDSKPFTLDHLFAAADSNNSHRPRLTLEPLGKASGLAIDTRFKSKQFEELAEAIRSGACGRHILICWHHEQIPQLLKAFGADPASLLPSGQWPDDVYGWLIELRFDANGNLVESKRINENLMPGDSARQNN